MRLLYYFNGFNSAIPPDWSDNAKVVAVERYAERHGFRFLPTTVDYRRACERADEILDTLSSRSADAAGGLERIIFAGSSMGGWYARIMQLLLAAQRPGQAIEALAFNPAFDLGRHGDKLLGPQVNHVTGESYEWTNLDSEALGRLESQVDFDAPLPYFVYVDKDDEVIAWELSAQRHRAIARFRAFDGGSHLFEHADRALADFHAAPRDSAPSVKGIVRHAGGA